MLDMTKALEIQLKRLEAKKERYKAKYMLEKTLHGMKGVVLDSYRGSRTPYVPLERHERRLPNAGHGRCIQIQ